MSLERRIRPHIRGCQECNGSYYAITVWEEYYCTARDVCKYQEKSDYRIPYCMLLMKKEL